jgi:SAM-dependent MidA family methyltransferase
MTLAAALAARIAAEGPLTVAAWMEACNAHYYATRDPFGPAGDFVTAPEISQMFGELVGLCLADQWDRAGRPADAVWVELGPGRGTLTRDAMRAVARAGLHPAVHFVETSPILRAAQARAVPGAIFHGTIETLPDDRPLLIAANEFFDALPVRQMVRTGDAWCERGVDWQDGAFVPAILPGTERGTAAGGGEGSPLSMASVEAPFHQPAAGAPPQTGGDLIEASPAALAITTALARRLAAQGGAMLAIDYGHIRTAAGETLQAVSAHAYASPWENPGERDLTAHIDFAALAAAARAGGATTHGPIEQGQFLTTLGLAQRAATLARATPDRGEAIAAAYRRLSHPDEMGRLFKVLCLTGGGWPAPAGC